MKILHILSSSKFSGAENVACQIIQMYEGSEYQMCYCSPDGAIKDKLNRINIEFLPINGISVSEVRRAIKEYSPDIVHAHDMRASYITARACGRTPLISHVHNNNFNSRGISAKSIAYLLAALKAKHILWVSKSSFDGYCFNRFLKGKSTILYNVIDLKDLEHKSQIGEDKYGVDILYLGRLTYQKNPLRLINILKLALEKNNKLKIGIVGDGDMKDVTLQKVYELELDRNIHFVGYCNNPMRMLKDAKVMLMSSFWEGTPMCALESLGLGTPVISTPVDGLKDIVKSGKNGYLSDSDEDLASMIVKICEDAAFREMLSNNAINDARKINDINTYRKTLLDIYTKALI